MVESMNQNRLEFQKKIAQLESSLQSSFGDVLNGFRASSTVEENRRAIAVQARILEQIADKTRASRAQAQAQVQVAQAKAQAQAQVARAKAQEAQAAQAQAVASSKAPSSVPAEALRRALQ